MSKNLLSKFYKGQLPFHISFWGFFIGLNLLPQLITGYLFFQVKIIDDKFLILPTILIFFPIQIYTLIGTWRSSKTSSWRILGRWGIVIIFCYNLFNNLFTYTLFSLDSLITVKNNTISDSIQKEKDTILSKSKVSLKCSNKEQEQIFINYNLDDMTGVVSKSQINLNNKDIIEYKLQESGNNKYFFSKENLFFYVLNLNFLEFKETRSYKIYNCVKF